MNIGINEMKSAYAKHQHLQLAAKELGMKWQTLYWNLKKHNVCVVGNKESYGTDSDRFAANAEKEFKKLVPSAINMNNQQFQSKWDYEIHGLKIDIKASNLRLSNSQSKSKRWAFSVKKQEMLADYIVGMAYKNDELHKIFLFPMEAVKFMTTISISERGSKLYGQYEISQCDLTEFFEVTVKN